ncbi:PAS domain S-box protein [soil metagenome]
MTAAANWLADGSHGYGLAVASVAAVLLLRQGLEVFGKFYYLPLIPAVMLPALFASRGATILAIVLLIAANLLLVPRESATDALVNAALFAIVGLGIGEFGRAREAARASALELKSRLTTRDATIHAMLASAPVVTLDPISTITTISRPACALFKVREADAVGRSFLDFVEFFDPTALRTTSGEYPTRDQYWLGRRSDGDVFPLGIQMALVDATGRAPDAILTLTDLSLWHSAEVRNQELGDQLNQVWRMNSLGEIAATLAHELNQPLTAAASYLQATKSDLDRAGVYADSASRTIDLAKGQVLRAGDIIRRARDLLAVDSLPLQSERLSSMIDDLGPILQLLGPAAGAQVQIDIEDTDDSVLADRIQFQQAIVNLVRNAVDAVSDQARRDVMIRGRIVSPLQYRISVEDSGPGVAPDMVERMFQPLMTTKAGGMGLGLSVTRTIVESHGGSLVVQASDLGGAAFAFNLKRRPDGRGLS